MGNCYRDCKNIHILGFCASLVKAAAFKKVTMPNTRSYAFCDLLDFQYFFVLTVYLHSLTEGEFTSQQLTEREQSYSVTVLTPILLF